MGIVVLVPLFLLPIRGHGLVLFARRRIELNRLQRSAVVKRPQGKIADTRRQTDLRDLVAALEGVFGNALNQRLRPHERHGHLALRGRPHGRQAVQIVQRTAVAQIAVCEIPLRFGRDLALHERNAGMVARRLQPIRLVPRIRRIDDRLEVRHRHDEFVEALRHAAVEDELRDGAERRYRRIEPNGAQRIREANRRHRAEIRKGVVNLDQGDRLAVKRRRNGHRTGRVADRPQRQAGERRALARFAAPSAPFVVLLRIRQEIGLERDAGFGIGGLEVADEPKPGITFPILIRTAIVRVHNRADVRVHAKRRVKAVGRKRPLVEANRMAASGQGTFGDFVDVLGEIEGLLRGRALDEPAPSSQHVFLPLFIPEPCLPFREQRAVFGRVMPGARVVFPEVEGLVIIRAHPLIRVSSFFIPEPFLDNSLGELFAGRLIDLDLFE